MQQQHDILKRQPWDNKGNGTDSHSVKQVFEHQAPPEELAYTQLQADIITCVRVQQILNMLNVPSSSIRNNAMLPNATGSTTFSGSIVSRITQPVGEPFALRFAQCK